MFALLAKLFWRCGILGGASCNRQAVSSARHSDAVRGQDIAANLQLWCALADKRVSFIAMGVLYTHRARGADSRRSCRLVYECDVRLYAVAMVVVLYQLVTGDGSKLLGYFI